MALSVENHDRPTAPLTVVVMGVSGVGKTTLARMLADRLGLPFAEADDFHPAANIAKMSAGIPLDDEDRAPWLRAIGAWLKERTEDGTGGVVTCSALKHRYRDNLRAACPGAFFLHLSGGHGLVEGRLNHRTGHFMPSSLLDSQYATLEPLGADERGAVLDVGPSPEELVEMAAALLRPVNGDLA
ncbi:gluconokinase [Kitasatospora sp. NPDC101447]|uniref:gluconokinase n=1 Tax=Kitasatospora sp. NPDC101447 TaxID=3364102 RepID=UPI0038149386